MLPNTETLIGIMIILATLIASRRGHKTNNEVIDGFHDSRIGDEDGRATDRIIDGCMWGCLSLPFIGAGLFLIIHGLSR
jgi:hypothetical protein